MAAKRHHSSRRKEHITAHDRAVDRRNLEHARESREHHSSSGHHLMVHHPHHTMHSGYYGDMHSRRRQELEDAGMIHEDHNAIANLPQEVMIKPYPNTGPYMPEGLDDTIRGIDHQMNYDDSQRRKNFYPKKV